MEPKERIIVALDVPTLREGLSLVRQLSPHVGLFKVGLELLTSEGAPRVVKTIHKAGGAILYDGKFDDIPNTVAGASRAVAAMGVKMFNVHASAGAESVAAAVANKGNSLVFGVTVLTSITPGECAAIFGGKPDSKVIQFAWMLVEVGADGIICSPQELELLRQQRDLKDFPAATPGVRPAWAIKGDQKRVMTPAEAVKAGADYLVIGRPITKPPEEIGGPVVAAQKIAEEIARAM